MSWNWQGEKVKRELRKQAGEVLFDAAEHVLEEANRTVPHEEGILEDSGFTNVDKKQLVATIGYDTPYARRQHEELNYRHADGRRAKWLEKTMQERHDAVMDHFAERLGLERRT